MSTSKLAPAVQHSPAAEKPATERVSARERLLTAASELFYEEGINTVGIDRVIAHAGVAKASLYSAFGSKDELIRAYLEAKFQARRERMLKKLATRDNPRDKLLGIYEVMAEIFEESDFRGCAFIRASAEAKPDSMISRACDSSRAWTRGLFLDLAREAGAANPEQLAQQLVVIYDGAIVTTQMDRDTSTATAARAMAAALIDAATRKPA